MIKINTMLLLIFSASVVNGDNGFSFLSANVAKDHIDRVVSNLRKSEKIPITDARSLHASNSWIVLEYWAFQDNDYCQGEPFLQQAIRNECVGSGSSSNMRSCSDNGTSIFINFLDYANTDCSGTPVSQESFLIGSGCDDGSRIKCLQRSDHFEIMESADYGYIEYVDNTCSQDETNIAYVQSFNVAGRCFSANESFSAMLEDCGRTEYLYDDSDCTNLVETRSYVGVTSYLCQNNGTRYDDYYVNDDDNYAGSRQNFCAADASENDADADADADAPIRLKPSPGLRKKIWDKGRFSPLQMTPPHTKPVEIDILLHQQEVTEQQQGILKENAAPVTSSWGQQLTSFWLIGLMVLFAGGVAVAKLLKVRNDFQKIPENSTHSI